MPSQSVPFIPEDAPFTPEQRAWLNGFLAGMFSGTAPEATPVTQRTLTLLVGSQTGTGDALARTFAKDAKQRGFRVMAAGMDGPEAVALRDVETLLVIASTHGEGDPPDNARAFYDRLHAPDAPRLDGLRYAVLALGIRITSTSPSAAAISMRASRNSARSA